MTGHGPIIFRDFFTDDIKKMDCCNLRKGLQIDLKKDGTFFLFYFFLFLLYLLSIVMRPLTTAMSGAFRASTMNPTYRLASKVNTNFFIDK